VRFKEYNKIIKEYKQMAKEARNLGNEYAALCCEIIAEDLELLKKQGALSLLPSKASK